MHYQHLTNFITNSIRKNDIYVPSMILFLVKNGGWATKEQVAKLIYIFENKHTLEDYETIVSNFSATILEDYNVIKIEDDIYKLQTWPLNNEEIDSIITQCTKVSNGFFTNLHIYSDEKMAS